MTTDLDPTNQIEHEEETASRDRLRPMPGDAFDFEGPPPTFFACASCERMTTMKRCYECSKRAIEARAREGEREAREARERARREEEKALLEASIPPEFADAKIDSFDVLRERVRLRDTVKRVVPGQVEPEWDRPDLAATFRRIVAHPMFITFWGPARQGKTTLAVAALREREVGLFVCARDLTLARAHHKLGEGEAPLVKRCLRASLLLLDDLGEEEPGKDCPIVHVLKTRFSLNMPTWVTTGLRGDEIAARYGTGVKARLTDQPRAWIVPFGNRERKPS